ncbi:MAG: hypothetical protein ACRDY7_09780 [Acidimicrobiia bacterium]
MPRQRYTVSQVGPDVDLDTEDVRLPDGRRLTNELAEQIAAEEIARHRGRPSVTGAGERTPNLTVRVPLRIREALAAIAESEGRRVSDVSRDALEEYVRHRNPTQAVTKTAKAGRRPAQTGGDA